MKNKNLVIAAVGDSSLHKQWKSGNPAFDLILIYYGNSDLIFFDYSKDVMICIKQNGQKFPLIKSFIETNLELISQYDYVWLPDDDISISADDLNRLFETARTYSLQICQPALISLHGDVSASRYVPGMNWGSTPSGSISTLHSSQYAVGDPKIC